MYTRLRRNRKAPWIRDLMSETTLSPAHLILPIFIVEGHNQLQEIAMMPGVYRHSIDQLVITAEKAKQAGIKAIALFPSVDTEFKNQHASEAYNPNNLICRAVRYLKAANIDIGIICDVALDPYTSHGHDGIILNGDVSNDETVKALCTQSLVLAEAGVDIVAPSDMMDGRIISIRNALDDQHFTNINVLAYAAKYNSSFYGPFRDALNNKNRNLDKSTYQLDIRNFNEAMREIECDIAEKADMVMIKPAMPFLDVIHAASKKFAINIFAYQVSGEYAMLKIASDAGALDWQRSILESLISIKRAGASAIFTYAALEVAEILNLRLIK